ncbi:hypothetical protein ACP3V5_21545 [Vibrio maritimus]
MFELNEEELAFVSGAGESEGGSGGGGGESEPPSGGGGRPAYESVS